MCLGKHQLWTQPRDTDFGLVCHELALEIYEGSLHVCLSLLSKVAVIIFLVSVFDPWHN